MGCDYAGQVVDLQSAVGYGPLKDHCIGVYEQSPYDSIVAASWYILQTMTVVGYGNLMLTTPLGKFIGTFALISGLLTIALPISIIETNFNRQISNYKVKMVYNNMKAKFQKRKFANAVQKVINSQKSETT